MSKVTTPDAARLRITLLDLDPAPWREVEVPLSMTFSALHDTIQVAFLWFNCHLWEFDFDGKRYGIPFEEDFGGDKIYNAKTTRLTKLRNSKVTEFIYTYDMGDNWEHHIEILDLFDMPSGSHLPVFIDGQWRTPPEDVGGTTGFEIFLEAISDPSHEEYENLIDWNDGPFNREDIESEIIKIQMNRLANMRRPKK